jgi:hypothetical protein
VPSTMVGRNVSREWSLYGAQGYVGLTFYPYQLTLGLSLRWFERRPHFRLYVGPLKLYGGLSA